MFLEIKFEGGLGNQLFQYATARSLSVQKKIPYLLLNTDSYHKQSLGRTFALGQLQISGTEIKNNFVRKIFRPNTKLNKIFTFIGLYKHIEEHGFTLQSIEKKIGVLTSLDGFWQSASYFNAIRNILLKEYCPLQIPQLPAWMQHKNTVAIHVRRTDYLAEKRYGFIGEKYYWDAIELVQVKISAPLFIFFSDDMAWCKATFTDSNIIFCEDIGWAKDYLQLYLMSKCTHQVISNSSFSWWGAWLNTNAEKIVIRPMVPFNDKNLLYQSHYPEEWIALNNI